MKNNVIKSAAFILGAVMLLSGCGSSGGNNAPAEDPNNNGNNNGNKDPLELESDGKTLLFYTPVTNEQYAFTVDSEEVLDLQQPTNDEGEDISNFNMPESEKGKYVVWIDDKGDTNASNDEEKVVMFKQEYSFADHNATYEDFYYLGHFHAHDHEGEMEYHLAAHDNDEFNVTDPNSGKYKAMVRLNQFLAQQQQIEESLKAKIPAQANGLCRFHTFESEEGETQYYVMGTNGTMYVYDDAYNYVDEVAVEPNCEPYKSGMSSTEDGVLYFSGATQTVYSVDHHEDGIYHIHSQWTATRLIGEGSRADMMVGIKPLIK